MLWSSDPHSADLWENLEQSQTFSESKMNKAETVHLFPPYSVSAQVHK